MFYIIVAALYNKTHPDYVSYLYLLAPVSLVILNPFGFVLMEIGKQESLPPAESGRRKLTMATNIMYSIITNPVVLMTVLGMITNFICNHKLPTVLADTLNVSCFCMCVCVFVCVCVRTCIYKDRHVNLIFGTSVWVETSSACDGNYGALHITQVGRNWPLSSLLTTVKHSHQTITKSHMLKKTYKQQKNIVEF